ncbi:MAG: D-alanyl-D-alanine carboxypeptidase [Lachnospiraceae bacterium]|nr:D-alanyl-D-alanine carboxypeptidase [Lachnospiraceae bacterium]
MKYILSFVLPLILTLNYGFCNFKIAYDESKISTNTDCYVDDSGVDLNITSKSAVLIEAKSGKVLYEKNPNDKLKPASVTKIMTLLLCYDQIKSGNMNYDDTITISEHAASMGGSQCFFEAGEQQTVFDIIKCIEISSGNDAAVAMGEHIAGSEEEFVKLMNSKAKELGMNDTNFENACGLDSDNHYTSAYDIGIMSRELITKHPEIFEISTIWMDHIIHKTSKGESRFDLANTNKFLRQYTGANGLKTGYTSDAGYCMSGTATRDDITLIAVVMGAETKEIRNEEVGKLLDFGFSKCTVYTDDNVLDNTNSVPVKNGVKKYVTPQKINEHTITLVDADISNIKKDILLYDNLKAPIREGDIIGLVKYTHNNEIIDEIHIYSSENILKKSYSLSIRDLCNRFFVVE